MPETITFLLALMGGVLPILLWLWFWLKEDAARPEPRGLIILSFIAGMITVPLVIPMEQFALAFFQGSTVMLIFAWSAIEELMKYFAARTVVLRRCENDEPIDPMIYMITVALGFAALENVLFLLNPDLSLTAGIITGNLRFIGATLLHVLASAAVGAALGLAFYKSKAVKRFYLLIGLTLSVILHALFNLFIITSNGEKILTVFAFVWIGIILLLLFFEKIKRIRNITL